MWKYSEGDTIGLRCRFFTALTTTRNNNNNNISTKHVEWQLISVSMHGFQQSIFLRKTEHSIQRRRQSTISFIPEYTHSVVVILFQRMWSLAAHPAKEVPFCWRTFAVSYTFLDMIRIPVKSRNY